MRRCCVALAVFVGSVGTGGAHGDVATAVVDDPYAIYGYVRRAVVEPSLEQPERIQLWGTFSVAAGPAGDEFHAPETGYLYFRLPAQRDVALREWNDLNRLATTGGPWTNAVGRPMMYGIAGFAARGGRVRVRSANEQPAAPDEYAPGAGVAQVSYADASAAVRMLGRQPKPMSRTGYARVDRVDIASDNQRIEIRGTFVLPTSELDGYGRPVRGTLVFIMPNDGRDLRSAQTQIAAWQSAAAGRRIVRFHSFTHVAGDLVVQGPGDPPRTPVPITKVGLDSAVVREDTSFLPIVQLRAVR